LTTEEIYHLQAGTSLGMRICFGAGSILGRLKHTEAALINPVFRKKKGDSGATRDFVQVHNCCEFLLKY